MMLNTQTASETSMTTLSAVQRELIRMADKAHAAGHIERCEAAITCLYATWDQAE